MKHPPHSTLHAMFTARAREAGEPARSNPIAAILEALYQMQRRQAMRVIRAYLRVLEKPEEITLRATASDEDRCERR